MSEILDFVVNSADVIFYGMLVIGVIGLAIGWFCIPTKARGKTNAGAIAEGDWYVKDIGVTKNLVALELLRITRPCRTYVGFGSDHPDFEVLKRVTKLQSLKFRFQAEPVEGVFRDTNTSAYLRLESAGNVW